MVPPENASAPTVGVLTLVDGEVNEKVRVVDGLGAVGLNTVVLEDKLPVNAEPKTPTGIVPARVFANVFSGNRRTNEPACVTATGISFATPSAFALTLVEVTATVDVGVNTPELAHPPIDSALMIEFWAANCIGVLAYAFIDVELIVEDAAAVVVEASAFVPIDARFPV